MREALHEIANDRVLTFSHLVLGYLYILYELSALKGYKVRGSRSLRDIYFVPINDETTVEEVRVILDSFNQAFTRVVPMTTRTGIFGFNTGLYLFFNDLYPIGISVTPYEVHNGGFPGPFNTAVHDFYHLQQTLGISGTILYERTHMISLIDVSYTYQYREYFHDLAAVYRAIMKSDLPIGVKKGMILYIFILVHEYSNTLHCGYEKEGNMPRVDVDDIPSILRTLVYPVRI